MYLAIAKLKSKSACLRAFGKTTAWHRLASWVISQIPQTGGKGRKAAYLLLPNSPNAKMSVLCSLEKTESTGTFHHCCFGTATNWPREYFFYNQNSTTVAFSCHVSNNSKQKLWSANMEKQIWLQKDSSFQRVRDALSLHLQQITNWLATLKSTVPIQLFPQNNPRTPASL